MEQVILVDEQDKVTGAMEKMEAHEKAALHRAFSVFIFNKRGELLMQQRAPGKYHSGGLWTNSCCSHPRPDEDTLEAASRRLKEEMGFETHLTKAFDFIYRAEFDNGLTEHEFDHVFTGLYDGPVKPDPKEVCGYNWVSLGEIAADLEAHPASYTAWFHIAFPELMDWKKFSGV
ncbi:MAG: isopentenyl-diphosphate Delta-isomerase [Chitinophagaceae bacterium]|nr:isopentenyl-diphosphate Delta-isomerase [Chitinophagaceae bacterium]